MNLVFLLFAVLNAGAATFNGVCYAHTHWTLNLLCCVVSTMFTVWMLVMAVIDDA
ncbi:hypothetical protein [Mycobacterium paragordonae]|uniref:hypothetical protein n=1 Tax=Mycobacterium paragordonae TaxID=1389713 RepID=UPI00140CAE3F|nr:hypothetical protein [Mycobacterium paragordonae]